MTNTPDCENEKYQHEVLNAHNISEPEFNEAIESYWRDHTTSGNSFSSDEISSLLADGTCGNSLVLCTASNSPANDIVLNLVAKSGQPIPPIPNPSGSFACIYSYDLLNAVLQVHQPDSIVFYKSSLPSNSRAIIFKAVRNGQDVYLADVVNTLP